jgi:hypothetical protein
LLDLSAFWEGIRSGTCTGAEFLDDGLNMVGGKDHAANIVGELLLQRLRPRHWAIGVQAEVAYGGLSALPYTGTMQ